MLIEYKVENYKSIRNEVSITMEAYMRDFRNKESIFKVSKGLNILPLACIYGQNASGKSNFIESLSYLKRLVTISKDFNKNMKIGSIKFMFDDISRNKATRFFISFMNHEAKFGYSLSLVDDKVEEESLFRNDEILFKRVGRFLDLGASIPKEERSKIEFVMGMTNDNALLLSKCSQSNITPMIESAFNWFDEKLKIIDGNRFEYPLPIRMKNALSEQKPKVMEMLYRADFGISDISVEEKVSKRIPDELMGISEVMKSALDEFKTYKLTAEHEVRSSDGISKRYPLDFGMESHGTKRMADLVITWVEALEKGIVLVIDEFGNSLHPLLVDFLIDQMMMKEVNTGCAQILFTTHDALLAKRNRFRRDQVWFTSRDPNIGETKLYSWLDYDVRSDLEFTENYLAGRFGAIPNVRRAGKDI